MTTSPCQSWSPHRSGAAPNRSVVEGYWARDGSGKTGDLLPPDVGFRDRFLLKSIVVCGVPCCYSGGATDLLLRRP